MAAIATAINFGAQLCLCMWPFRSYWKSLRFLLSILSKLETYALVCNKILTAELILSKPPFAFLLRQNNLHPPSTQWKIIDSLGYKQWYCLPETQHRVATSRLRRIYIRRSLSLLPCARISQDLYPDHSDCIVSYRWHSFSTLWLLPVSIACPCTPSPWSHSIFVP